MPKKPDRFELITMKNAWLAERMGPRLAILQEDVAKLLRAEHAWMRRMVKSAYETAREMELSKQGFKYLIIEQLRQRRK